MQQLIRTRCQKIKLATEEMQQRSRSGNKATGARKQQDYAAGLLRISLRTTFAVQWMIERPERLKHVEASMFYDVRQQVIWARATKRKAWNTIEQYICFYGSSFQKNKKKLAMERIHPTGALKLSKMLPWNDPKGIPG